MKLSVLMSLYNEQHGKCVYCLRSCSRPVRNDPRNKPDSPTIEHRVPKSRGGDNKRTNLMMACYACNSTRGANGNQSFAGPTRHDIPDNLGSHNTMVINLWLDSIERLLEKAARCKCPRLKTARIKRVKWVWAQELLSADLEYWVKVTIREIGETITNAAYVQCWSPKLHMMNSR